MRKAPFSSRLKIAVFMSGTGRLFKNFLDCQNDDYEVVCVAADRHCRGFTYAFDLPIRISSTDGVLLDFADKYGADVVCLAGYLSLLKIPDEWENRVLNIHPSLIPDFCGKSMYGSKVHEAVIAAGVKESGCTVHFCDNEYDHGEIILQKKLPVSPDWDADQLASAVFDLEKSAYPEALSLLIAK